jgi:hypothetical protein
MILFLVTEAFWIVVCVVVGFAVAIKMEER